jgi:hypothetical protein
MKVANIAAAQSISNLELSEPHKTGKSNTSGIGFAAEHRASEMAST